MGEAGAFEAKNKLGQLLDLVERGEGASLRSTARRWRASSRRKKPSTATRRGLP
jgi:hypothetical protein